MDFKHFPLADRKTVIEQALLEVEREAHRLELSLLASSASRAALQRHLEETQETHA